MTKSPEIKKPSSGLQFRREHSEDLLLIDGYGDGGFRVKGRRFEGAIYLNGNGVWPLELTKEGEISPSIVKILDTSDIRPEIILVGTGTKMLPLNKCLREALLDKNFTGDPMDSGAAARTYNVLLMESRRVAALLLPVL